MRALECIHFVSHSKLRVLFRMSFRFYFNIIQIELFGLFFRIDANSWWMNKFAYQLINNSLTHSLIQSQEIKFNIWYDRTIFRHCYYLIYRRNSISPFRKRNSQTKNSYAQSTIVQGLKQLEPTFPRMVLSHRKKTNKFLLHFRTEFVCFFSLEM